MLTRKYVIKFERANTDELDPNLDLALRDIKSMHLQHDKEFDFEVSALFDGFMIDKSFDAILNTFLHDIMDEESVFNYIYRGKLFEVYVKAFIKDLLKQPTRITNDTFESSCVMDAFIWTKVDGNLVQFSTSFVLPRTIITEEKYEQFMGLGPDYLVVQLTHEQIFEYLMAPLYYELAQVNALDNKALKDFGRYRIGLH